MKVFFIVCGSRGDEERVQMVREEERGTVENKLDKVFYSHIYSVQSSELQLEEFVPENIELPRTMKGNKQMLIHEFLSTPNPQIFDSTLAASTSTKAITSEFKSSKQSSIKQFVYKKQIPSANPQWMQGLKFEFENLESSNEPSEEGLEDIVCNWTDSDFENYDFFEENIETKLVDSRDVRSEHDITV